MAVRRILVAIDASPGSVVAATAAARLASVLKAEIEGLFVEDVRLLRLADSPLAREVGTITPGHRRPGGEETRRQLRIQGLRAREALRRIADREGIKWSFRIARGAVSSEIAAAASEAEIVSLGHVGWSARPQRALGAAASAILEEQRSCTLLMRRSLDVRSPVLLLFDGSEQAERGLRLAEQLSQGNSEELRILLVGPDERELRAQITGLADGAAPSVVGVVSSTTDPALGRALADAEPGSLVVPVGGGHREILHDIFEQVDCPVFLVS